MSEPCGGRGLVWLKRAASRIPNDNRLKRKT